MFVVVVCNFFNCCKQLQIFEQQQQQQAVKPPLVLLLQPLEPQSVLQQAKLALDVELFKFI